jgi:signal transduction histidine kinase/response regulator of citrate/malate metabolism
MAAIPSSRPVLRRIVARLLLLGFAGLVPPAQARQPVVRLIEGGEVPVQGAVWAVTQTPDGTLFVGSNELDVFDGDRWQRVETPGTAVFRGLAASPDGTKVYVGAMGSVGYLARGPGGDWKYISLTKELQATDQSPLADVWSVFATPRGAIWITDDRVLRYTDRGEGPGKFEVFPLPAQPRLSAFAFGGEVLVYQSKVGLLRAGTEGPPQRFLPESELPARDATWLVAAPGTREIALLGLGDAAYRRHADGQWEKLPELSAALAGTVPTAAVSLEGSAHPALAIATLKGGIILSDQAGRVLGRITGQNGLPDDSVNALWAARGKLWAALGSGLARIDGPGAASLYPPDPDLGPGTPLKVLVHQGKIFALTTKGFFEINDATEPVRPGPLLRAEARLWDAASLGDDLWVGGFGGAWRRDESGQMVREHAVSADVFLLGHGPAPPGAVLALENYSAELLVPSPYGWATRATGLAVKDTPVSLAETIADGRREVWIATLAGLIYRTVWREPTERGEAGRAPQLRPQRIYGPGSGLPEKAASPRLLVLDGKVIAFAGPDILRAPLHQGAFEPLPGLGEFRGIAGTSAGDRNYWLLEPKLLAGAGGAALWRVRTSESGEATKEPLDVPGLAALGTVTAVNWTPGTGELWFSGSRGLLRVAVDALQTPPPPPAVLLFASYPDESGAPQFPERSAETALPAEVKRVDFRFAVPAAAGGETYYYQTQLRGVDQQWTPPTRSAARQFAGLAPGAYAFRVRVVDRFGRTGSATAWAFRLAAPWYQTPAAWIGYGLGALLVVAGGVRWRLSRMKQLNERLNRLVAERTRELELSNTAKSEFLENISHELRNPLNGMMGMIGELAEERLQGPDRGVLRTLQACSGQMAQAFEDVLGFSKLEYGYVKVERKPFQLQRTLAEVVALLGPVAGQRGNRLSVVWPEGLGEWFVGDAGKIKTVVGNFVSNALKYAPGTPVEIKVEAQPVTAGGGPEAMAHLLIEVTDQGPGVPLDEQELIFKKFVRGAGAKAVAGTGLGLATCHVLAKLMNGSVGVESTPGRGSTFYLRVLVARTAAPPGETKTGGDADETGTRRALIVEDELYNQAVLQGIALRLGFEVEVAADATAAQRFLAAREYRVVFLDWELPGAKGDEVARMIRSRPGAQPVILATTAHDSDEIREKCAACGMDGFLLKPYSLAKVQQALAEIGPARRIASWPADAEPGTGLDLEAFANYARAKPEAAEAAAGLYCAAVAWEVQALQAALGKRDVARMGSCAHRLRALAGLIGATELSRAATRLEAVAKNGTDGERAEQARLIAAASAELSRALSGGAESGRPRAASAPNG